MLHGLVQQQDEPGLDEVLLHDHDPARLATMTGLVRHLCRTWSALFELRGEDDPRAALAGARFVFAHAEFLTLA